MLYNLNTLNYLHDRGMATNITSEAVNDRIGNAVTTTTATTLMVNQGVSALKGKKSVVDTVLDMLKKALTFLSKKIL